ncbi:MAG: phosphate acyltransferase [Omnitrophica bacterium RIFCSPHIGHO2_02_FULL_63_14]|nr:MAG: phosphate acyltransferase [Omnitrophica bacterium RIFCSPHIGHO2_02_FULL_63_14]
MRIAVDGMGGDHAPQAVVAGAVAAARSFGFRIVLVGDQNLLRSELDKHRDVPSNVTVHHAGSFIRMDESATVSVRKKKDASISVCADLAKEGLVDAIVTAGHTGAAVVACTLKLRLLEGVDRPGIGILLPTLGTPTFLIDVGANIDTKPVHLYQYAVMGDVYFRFILRKNRPSVGILNIGEEEAKGTEYVKEAHQLLNKSRLYFLGNVEGRDIFNGKVDIVVCDGFVGNVVLKVSESIADVIGKLLKQELKKNWITMLGALLAKPAFDALRKEVDYSEYGGAPLLGVNGNCIISHGSSNAKAIKNAIRVAGEFVKYEINQHILEAIRHQEMG